MDHVIFLEDPDKILYDMRFDDALPYLLTTGSITRLVGVEILNDQVNGVTSRASKVLWATSTAQVTAWPSGNSPCGTVSRVENSSAEAEKNVTVGGSCFRW
jgi:hypothetical protein